MKRNPEKLVFFAVAVMVHALLFIYLTHSHIRMDDQTPPEQDESTFLKVKVAPQPATPPPPPPPTASGATPPPIPTSVSVPVPDMPQAIVTTSSASFTMPKVQINDSVANKMALSQDAMSGNLAPGMGSLYGLTINKSESVVAVLDESGSMTSYIAELEKEIMSQFPRGHLMPSCSALGKFDTPQTADKNCDLYEAAKRGIDQNPETTAVFLMTDFEDGETPEDTQKFIQMLKDKNIKLFIRSVELAPYNGLKEYAAQSGGDCQIGKPGAPSQ